RIDRLAVGLVGDRLATIAQYRGEHLAGRLLEADREAAGTGTVGPGEVGGEAVGILVDEEVDAALAVDGDWPGLVPQRGGEAHAGGVVVQQLTLAFGCGEFDDLEDVD